MCEHLDGFGSKPNLIPRRFACGASFEATRAAAKQIREHVCAPLSVCAKATKKIFFAFFNKVSNPHGLLYQRLSHLQSSGEYHSDLLLGFDDHALDYLSNDLIIVFHGVVLESVENGVYFLKS